MTTTVYSPEWSASCTCHHHHHHHHHQMQQFSLKYSKQVSPSSLISCPSAQSSNFLSRSRPIHLRFRRHSNMLRLLSKRSRCTFQYKWKNYDPDTVWQIFTQKQPKCMLTFWADLKTPIFMYKVLWLLLGDIFGLLYISASGHTVMTQYFCCETMS